MTLGWCDVGIVVAAVLAARVLLMWAAIVGGYDGQR